MSPYMVLPIVLYVTTPDLGKPVQTCDQAPIEFEDAQAAYRQNRNAFRSLHVRWRRTVEYTETDRAYRKLSGMEPVLAPQISTFDFWTDGTKWRLLWWQEDTNAWFRISSPRREDFPPIAPVRGSTLMELQPNLPIIDQVMLQDWATSRHICDRCTAVNPRHYFELLGDEVPHERYLTPQERSKYRSRAQLFTGWLIEVNFEHGGLPVRMWKWSRTYLDGEEMTPEKPLLHIRHGRPDLEITRVRRIVPGGYYPVEVVWRQFVLKPEVARKGISFEDRIRRRGECPLSRAAVKERRYWKVLAITANTPSGSSPAFSAAPTAFSTTQPAQFPATPFGKTRRAAVGPGGRPALWLLFLTACFLAALGFLVQYTVRKLR